MRALGAYGSDAIRMDPMTKQLADAQQCGVYQLIRELDEVERAAENAGLAVRRIDIRGAQEKKDFLKAVETALSFPAWFGHNWDALHDCLTDLDWLPNKTGYVLIFENSDYFARADKQAFEDGLAVLHSAAEYWKMQGRPFWGFIAASKRWESMLPKWPSV
jgi:RNAse (barnase) inhibitor barstar